MHTPGQSSVFSAVLALALQACATPPSQAPVAVATHAVAHTGIDTAQRALPTIATSVSQPAHYQHVYIDTRDANAGSLQTITLEDAVKNSVLASADIQVKRLDHVDADSLKWVVLDKGFARPKELEGVGGVDVLNLNFAEVNFALNETEILNPTKLNALLKVAGRVGGVFYVVGYADESGIESKNQTLSQDRAKAVADSLVAGGVNPLRVKATGAGISRTYRGLDANRRASITFRVIE